MPGQSGIEFLRRVRQDWPELPFILFTGRGSEEVASRAISAGVTDYLEKGSGSKQYELLVNRIDNAVQARRSAERLARQEQLARVTELSSDAGGWELNLETEQLLLTAGTCQLLGLQRDVDLSLGEALELYKR